MVEVTARRASLTIPGRFPSLNEYVAAGRRNRYQSAKIKQTETTRAARAAAGIAPFSCPVRVSFLWVEPNRRRDLDNVAFSKKFILDGLVAAGVLVDDSPRYVVGLQDAFEYDKTNPRVEVVIEECDETSR